MEKSEEPRNVEAINDYVVVSKVLSQTKPGIITIEARVRDNIELEDTSKIRDALEAELSKPDKVFDVGADLFDGERTASLLPTDLHSTCRDNLECLKVAEYAGPDREKTCHSSDSVRVKVHVYKLYDTGEEKEGLQQAGVKLMPHVSFEGHWDNLVFERDLQGDLIRTMNNILRFSKGRRPDMNPLILLYGPPGTGKTSLCQGLAQKVSIRLSSTYKQTKLIQIKTATLLSKYYSQSAKQIDEIFTSIEKICEEHTDQFVCVLIDEVESIANTRESSMHGEALDSLRATNALLTGLDRAKRFSNVIFLCTSNMIDCLDDAFLDRCGLKMAVDPPPASIQYEILRGKIQNLIKDQVIISNTLLPSYRDANIELIEEDLPGRKLLRIVELLNSSNISGRALAQLPEQSILRYLGDEDCDLDMAFRFMKRNVKDNAVKSRKRKWEEERKEEDI